VAEMVEQERLEAPYDNSTTSEEKNLKKYESLCIFRGVGRRGFMAILLLWQI